MTPCVSRYMKPLVLKLIKNSAVTCLARHLCLKNSTENHFYVNTFLHSHAG